MEEVCRQYRRNSRGWRVDPVARVHSRIIVGAAHDFGIFLMSKYGITHVVNCAEDYFGNTNFKATWPERYACIGAIDSEKEDITKWYPEFEKKMNEFMVDVKCEVIYVHCECGVNRSSFLTLIYLCIKFGYAPETIGKSMIIQRPCVFTNKAFMTQAIEYIKKHQ
jgi:hypothetical protein